MSLKTRLRIAISLLMAVVVVSLSLLYVHGFLSNEFQRTADIAKSIAGQVQGATSARLDTLAEARGPVGGDIKSFWLDALSRDVPVRGMLARALNNWRLISAVYLTDGDGRILASTNADAVGKMAKPLAPIAEWDKSTVFANAQNVLTGQQDIERLEPLAILGEKKPFIVTHVVISRPVLRESFYEPLHRLAWIFGFSLVVSVLLSILLPNLVLDPLERLSARLDLMATGKLPDSSAKPQREAKEFAAVYSKLDVLGQQYQGARENADALRTNVEHLLERLEQAILLVDPNSRLIMAGRNAGNLLGVPLEALRNQSLFDLVPRDSDMGLILHHAMEARETVTEEVVTVDTPTGKRILSIACEPLLRPPDNRWMGTLVTLHDAEWRGQIKAELGLAERLTALSRLTRGVAHEIKNPLNAITLHLEILRTRLEEEAPELDVVRREISRLDRVVKTFLDFNRPIEPQMRWIDLSEVARDLSRLIAPQAAARKIQVELSAPDPAPLTGDRDLLQQAALNVITNAIDAMPAGGLLRIATRRLGGKCELIVSDTGIGIADGVRDQIFNLYFTTKPQGSGIGLAMAFRFVQLHDGKLEFFTESERGTTFRFVFPEAPSAARATASATRSHGI